MQPRKCIKLRERAKVGWVGIAQWTKSIIFSTCTYHTKYRGNTCWTPCCGLLGSTTPRMLKLWLCWWTGTNLNYSLSSLKELSNQSVFPEACSVKPLNFEMYFATKNSLDNTPGRALIFQKKPRKKYVCQNEALILNCYSYESPDRLIHKFRAS